MSTTYCNTLDLDNITKQQLQDIETKIKSNKCCLKCEHKDSNSKGYHVMILCNKQGCDLCRIVFDDQRRLEAEHDRKDIFKNVLFEKKEYCRGKKNLTQLDCERCAKYGTITPLNKKEITLEEVRKKCKIGQIPENYPPTLIYLGYDFYYCPICNWFKFVKKR
jgi:hypothetical protein